MTVVLVLWISFMVAMVIVPAGRRALRQAFRDVDHVLGFQPHPVRARARLPLAPAQRRTAEVAAAYVAGKFDYDELEWRILLALQPPRPESKARNWNVAQQAVQARMMRPVYGGSGGTGAVVVTDSAPWSGAASTESVPWSAAPRSPRIERLTARMEEGAGCYFRELHSGSGYIGTVCDCGHDMATHYNGGCNDCEAARCMKAPPKPRDAARSVLPARAHGDLSM